MPEKTRKISREVFDDRSGTLLARWRGTLAYLTESDNSPYHDALIGPVLQTLDNATALHVAEQFTAGFEGAAMQERQINLERQSTSAPNFCPLHKPHRLMSKDEALLRAFHWYGHYAYAKGIDCSPSHDRQTMKQLKSYPNDLVIPLIRAWEAGWDEAFHMAKEVSLDRLSILERPAIISARLVRRPTPN